MNRRLLVFVLFVAAALMGCGGNGASPDQPTPGNDAEPQPDVIGQDNEVPDAGEESDVNIPEVGQDADAGDEQTACTDQLCDECAPEGAKSTCSQLICLNGLWVMSDSDGGVASAPCIDQDAGDASDSDVGQDADAGDEPDVANDADAAAEAEAGQDAADAQSEPEPPPPENCNNNIDDDFDGLKDCFDSECASAPNCQSSICDGVNDVAEGFACNKGNIEYGCSVGGKYGKRTCGATCQYGACVLYGEICDDGLDNDYDGKRDCADQLCASAANCQCAMAIPGDACQTIGERSCGDQWECCCTGTWGVLNCSDSCLHTEICDNIKDDDGDNLKDCQDPDCHDTPPCKEVCNDGVDNDLDILADCIDPDCFDASVCIVDTCNGLDDNHDGIVDNGTGMQCAGTANNTRTCTTTCGSVGVETCSTSTCTWGACTKPALETKCTDGIDDDCNGQIDCRDANCWGNPACPHNWGPTCQPIQPGDGLNCSSWEKEYLPSEARSQFGCCANSANDKYCLAGQYEDLVFIHSTGGAWTQIPLPVVGAADGGGNLLCLGNNQVYMTYTKHGQGTQGGVFARWNGSSVVQLAASQTNGNMGPIFGKSASDIMFVAFDAVWSNIHIDRWNGSTLSVQPLPSFAPRRINGGDLWGTSMTDLYFAGALFDDATQFSEGLLLHYDGTSWARVPTSSEVVSFVGVHGTSSCDVMAVGAKRTAMNDGVTFQKNGSAWDIMTHSDANGIHSVIKATSSKYLLMGAYRYDGNGSNAVCGLVGTSNGDSTVNWYQPVSDPLDFRTGWVSFRVPGTNTYYITGDNSGFLMRAECQ